MDRVAQKRGFVDRVIDGIELAAAGFLAAVTVLTFCSVIARYAFNFGIPDSYDFSRNLLGILIFWGIAVASYRGDHITVDLLWSRFGPAGKRVIEIFAALFSLAAMLAFTWMMATKVIDTWRDNILTFDLRAPVWFFYLAAWIGLATAILLLVIRTIRLFVRPDSVLDLSKSPHIE